MNLFEGQYPLVLSMMFDWNLTNLHAKLYAVIKADHIITPTDDTGPNPYK